MVIAGPVMALRSRSACFFSAANPGIQYSGLGMESKFATLNLLPAHLRPKSILVPTGSSLADLTQRLDQAGISFPLIAKPDLGFRGLLVRKLNDLDSLQDYLKRYSIDFIVQEFLDHPEEVGVFYYRYPGAAKGTVASVTLKEFLKVTGDGRSTVRQLIMSNPRALLQLARLEESHAAILDRTPQPGETINLGEIGNHSKGTVFINGKTQIDDQLTETFDRFCKQIDGFYYGRFDIKCRNLESLKRGEDFKIIELNGINAEPTHIYQPDLLLGRPAHHRRLLVAHPQDFLRQPPPGRTIRLLRPNVPRSGRPEPLYPSDQTHRSGRQLVLSSSKRVSEKSEIRK